MQQIPAELPRISSPTDPAMEILCERLAAAAEQTDVTGDWPRKQLADCAAAGVFEWFLPTELGGQGWDEVDVIRGYLRLAAACLTTTFIITQRTGACQRIAVSENASHRAQLLPPLIHGTSFATVGISHLTTSRQHARRPVLRATQQDAGFVLEGFSPWVTGAAHAQTVVTGATLKDGRQILVALPMDTPGVEAAAPQPLLGLSASHTGAVNCHEAFVAESQLLAGPVAEVMKQGAGAKTGGLQTSTLALGLATAAIDYMSHEADNRKELHPAADSLREELDLAVADLLALAAGEQVCSTEQFRARANSLALRAAQASLVTAKGAGYVVGHPAGRWCREALFFLVWSCPQPVMAANLCELAGLGD